MLCSGEGSDCVRRRTKIVRLVEHKQGWRFVYPYASYDEQQKDKSTIMELRKWEFQRVTGWLDLYMRVSTRYLYTERARASSIITTAGQKTPVGALQQASTHGARHA